MSNSSGGKAWKYIQDERQRDFSTTWAILLCSWQKSKQVIAQVDAERGLISGSEKRFLEVCFKIVGFSLPCNQQLPVSLKKHMGSWILASLDVLAVLYLSFYFSLQRWLLVTGRLTRNSWCSYCPLRLPQPSGIPLADTKYESQSGSRDTKFSRSHCFLYREAEPVLGASVLPAEEGHGKMPPSLPGSGAYWAQSIKTQHGGLKEQRVQLMTVGKRTARDSLTYKQPYKP